ncbi:MAG: SBBP repeat-containing protein [Bacteroidota bacterium]|jgi:hypothetical protein
MKHLSFVIALSFLSALYLQGQWQRLSVDISKSRQSEKATEWKKRPKLPHEIVAERRNAMISLSGNRSHFSTGAITSDIGTASTQQEEATQWLPPDDEACGIVLDKHDGSVYVTGSSDSAITGSDFLTIKYTPEGNVVWSVRYNGPSNQDDYARAIAIDGEGNIYVTGESYGLGTDYDYATVKYNPAGEQQWAVRYNGPGNFEDKAADIAIDSTNSVYVTGYSYGLGTSCDYVTIKYSSVGVEQWVMRYNGPGDSTDVATKIRLDKLGNVYVAGYSYAPVTDFDYAIIKYSSSGIQQWVERYDYGNSPETSTILAVDNNSNIYISGCTYYPIGDGGQGYSIVKYNSDGELQWTKRDSHLYSDALAITTDDSLNVYIAAISNANPGLNKYNSAGEPQWGYGSGYISSIEVDHGGNIYVSGQVNGLFTAKFNSGGNAIWSAEVAPNGRSTGIVVDYDGNVYVTGINSIYTGTGWDYDNDYITLKYDSTGGNQWIAGYNGSGYTSRIDFGIVRTGIAYRESVTISNNGIGALTLDTTIISYEGITIGHVPPVIGQGDTCKINICYHPDSAGKKQGYIVCGFNGNSICYRTDISAYEATGAFRNGASVKKIVAAKHAVFAVTDDYGGCLYRSTDAGMNWELIFFKGVTRLALSPSGIIYVDRGDSLFSSTDNGLSWVARYGGGFSDVEVSPNGTVFCTSFYCGEDFCDGSVCRSTDNGLSWDTHGVGAAQQTSFFTNDHILIAGFHASYFWRETYFDISSDNGLTWNEIMAIPGFASVTALVVNPNNKIFVGLGDLHYSANLCTTWTKLSDIVPEALLALPSGEILAGTNGGGIFHFSDDGDSLGTLNDGLNNLNVHTLALDSLGYVYAGTDSGVFRSLLPPTGVVTSKSRIPTQYRLEQNYPNPFNPVTTINYQLPKQSHVTLKVFDVLGREVATLVNGEQAAGYKSVRWNAANMPSGIYFYRMNAGIYTDTKKLLLLK